MAPFLKRKLKHREIKNMCKLTQSGSSGAVRWPDSQAYVVTFNHLSTSTHPQVRLNSNAKKMPYSLLIMVFFCSLSLLHVINAQKNPLADVSPWQMPPSQAISMRVPHLSLVIWLNGETGSVSSQTPRLLFLWCLPSQPFSKTSMESTSHRKFGTRERALKKKEWNPSNS